MKANVEAIKRSIVSGIKPEVLLSREHDKLIEDIAEIWNYSPVLARRMERNLIAILNNETHDK